MNQTLIIVPTVNERENLPRVAQKLLALPVAVDLLVVDGNSMDGTGQAADELAAKHPEIHVLHEKKKNGLGRAYLAGFKWALERNYEFVFEMDCDFSHDPAEIPNFLKAAQNADLVLGSRYSGGVRVLNWPLKRLLLSRFAGIYVWIITGMPFTDPTGAASREPGRREVQRLQLPNRNDPPPLARWFSSGRGADHLRGPRGRHFQAVAAHCGRSLLDGLVAVAAKRFAPLAAQKKSPRLTGLTKVSLVKTDFYG
jgi:hypothetical protein